MNRLLADSLEVKFSSKEMESINNKEDELLHIFDSYIENGDYDIYSGTIVNGEEFVLTMRVERIKNEQRKCKENTNQ